MLFLGGLCKELILGNSILHEVAPLRLERHIVVNLRLVSLLLEGHIHMHRRLVALVGGLADLLLHLHILVLKREVLHSFIIHLLEVLIWHLVLWSSLTQVFIKHLLRDYMGEVVQVNFFSAWLLAHLGHLSLDLHLVGHHLLWHVHILVSVHVLGHCLL